MRCRHAIPEMPRAQIKVPITADGIAVNCRRFVRRHFPEGSPQRLGDGEAATCLASTHGAQRENAGKAAQTVAYVPYRMDLLNPLVHE